MVTQIEVFSLFLAGFFMVDRLIKVGTLLNFFGRTPPPVPQNWPTISMIQPITRGVTNLEENLRSRLRLDYPAILQHIFICDVGDRSAQGICLKLQQEYPSARILILRVEPDQDSIAFKISKLNAALEYAESEVLCFIDDDIAPPADALQQMIPYLLQPGVGATFGLACAASWNQIWSSLMSAFVNTNALMSYIPIAYFTEPFTITGHLFALSRENFEAAGGFKNMDPLNRFDDDHELARRLNAIGLKCVQTPVIYKVFNELFSWREYANQIKRWFVFPRQALFPYLSGKQQVISGALSVGLFIPSLSALLALFFPSPVTVIALVSILVIYLSAYGFCEICYLKQGIPLVRSPLLLVVALVTPLQILWALWVGNNEIIWRGQRLQIQPGGYFKVIE
ncbi:glycosyltransferase [Oscillatoria acuminata]|uniref:Glycosyl transferase n=1 Tax=Oscillatoria acuminata PCC 6304 TaxID=56110 RepID=K9TSA1_9CYAN|nr:glycosyltransferase family 2 protein [Oscillatoria acuminata]AFY84869.1 glycosyl transferase [Oscillatoria acuminata PCC 6304]